MDQYVYTSKGYMFVDHDDDVPARVQSQCTRCGRFVKIPKWLRTETKEEDCGDWGTRTRTAEVFAYDCKACGQFERFEEI